MSVNIPKSSQQSIARPSAKKRSIIAFILSLLGFVLPLLIQFAATEHYNATSSIVDGGAAWGPAIWIYSVLDVGFLGWPLGIAALIIGIVSLTTKAKHKGLAISAITIAGISILTLPILALVVSGVVGQPKY